jgi:hypothetical protein
MPVRTARSLSEERSDESKSVDAGQPTIDS